MAFFEVKEPTKYMKKKAKMRRGREREKEKVIRDLVEASRIVSEEPHKIVMVGKGKSFDVYLLADLKHPLVIKKLGESIPIVDNKSYQRALEEAKKEIKAHNKIKAALSIVPDSYIVNNAINFLKKRGIDVTELEIISDELHSMDEQLKELRILRREYVQKLKEIDEIKDEDKRVEKEMDVMLLERKINDYASIGKIAKEKFKDFRSSINRIIKERPDIKKELKNIIQKGVDYQVPRLYGVQMTFDAGPVQVFEMIPNIIVQEYFRRGGKNVEETIGVKKWKQLTLDGKAFDVLSPSKKKMRLKGYKWIKVGEERVPYKDVKRFIPDFVKMFIQAEAKCIPLDVHPGNFGIDTENNRLVYVDTSELFGTHSLTSSIFNFLKRFGGEYKEHFNELYETTMDELEKQLPPEKARRVIERVNELIKFKIEGF